MPTTPTTLSNLTSDLMTNTTVASDFTTDETYDETYDETSDETSDETYDETSIWRGVLNSTSKGKRKIVSKKNVLHILIIIIL